MSAGGNEMDKLDAMQVYVAVVDTHSFARAAEVLGQPRSTVSRVVKELEARSGAASPAHHPQAQRDGGGSPVL